MNDSLDNLEESTYKSAKERKRMEKHNIVRGFLKNTVNPKDDTLNQETVSSSRLGSSFIFPWAEGKLKPSLKLSQAEARTYWQI
jgi:hypothetical protein